QSCMETSRRRIPAEEAVLCDSHGFPRLSLAPGASAEEARRPEYLFRLPAILGLAALASEPGTPAIRARALHFSLRAGLVSRTRRRGRFYRASSGWQRRREKIARGVRGRVRVGCGQANRRPVAGEPRGGNRAPHATPDAILPSNSEGPSGAICSGARSGYGQVANCPVF